MSADRKTPRDLALMLLSGAMNTITLERGNEDLMSFDADQPGPLDLALTALMGNEAGKAVERLHAAVKLCAEPVADGRSQAQRARLLSAAAGALALLEQADYRGPDRRAGDDRRSEDRRHAPSTAPAQEQRCGEDRRSCTDRRTKAGAALWAAVERSEDAHLLLTYKLAPLLAVAEFAASAHHTLNQLDHTARYLPDLAKQLNEVDPEWRTALSSDDLTRNLTGCLSMAREMCEQAAVTTLTLTREAGDAMREVRAGTAG